MVLSYRFWNILVGGYFLEKVLSAVYSCVPYSDAPLVLNLVLR